MGEPRGDLLGFDAVIDELLSGFMDSMFGEIAPGVDGKVVDHGTHIEVVGVRAQVEGSGAVGRWLDSLPPHSEVWVPLVTSDRLAGMLDRRGYQRTTRPLSTSGERRMTYVRPPLISTHDPKEAGE